MLARIRDHVPASPENHRVEQRNWILQLQECLSGPSERNREEFTR